MEEKIIISAKTQNVLAGIFSIILGGVLMATSSVWERPLGDWAIYASIALGVVFALLGIFFMLTTAGAGLFVTDKRVYGKTLLGKRVDIPLDSISAVSLTFVLLYGLSVSSSSGRISFFLLAKRNEIYEVISKLLIERQNEKRGHTAEVPKDTAEELKKFKSLLDGGIITQEEFDAKKKELLGL